MGTKPASQKPRLGPGRPAGGPRRTPAQPDVEAPALDWIPGVPREKRIRWADVTEADLEPAERDSLGDLEGAEDVEGRDFVPLSQVMPNGKSKRDMCPECFQIPSNNGVCGC